MADGRLVINTEDDAATRALAQMLLATQIAAQVATCFLLVEMVQHGAISYRLAWYWQKYKAAREMKRKFRDPGYVIWEAEEIVRQHSDERDEENNG